MSLIDDLGSVGELWAKTPNAAGLGTKGDGGSIVDRSDDEQRVPDLDPSGVLRHLIGEIQVSLRTADNAEKLLIRLVQTAVERGTSVDSVAAELSLSKNDALVLVSGESMLKGRILRSQE